MPGGPRLMLTFAANMKQILQNLGSGQTSIEDVPAPGVRAGHLLIGSSASLVSAGTERMLMEFGKANLLDKARQQPDKVKMVIDKVKTDGLGPTIQSVKSKLDQPLPLGYSNVGTVIEVGAGVSGFSVGDRVVSNGPHAEIVCVPANLCAAVPAIVDAEAATFTVLGSIALQGIRLAEPTLGENVVVTGLGLIGLLTVQLLRANGCQVLGIDPDEQRCRLAASFGASTCCLSAGEDPLGAASRLSSGRGVDAVLITASTSSNEPVHQAAQMCRKRGRIVLVGVTGLELSRADFYEKELSFQVSCSYGPGRYDPDYEEKGQDYPFGLVRWTEQRNFEAVLGLMASGDIDVTPLISHRFPIEQAESAYEVLGAETPLGIVLQYPDNAAGATGRQVDLVSRRVTSDPATPVVAMIGAGNYAGQMLIPAFKSGNARLRSLVSAGGVSSSHAGKKHGFEQAGTDAEAAIADEDVNVVAIATRHNTHASYALRAILAGKHVFVEKPLCLALDELESIEQAMDSADAPMLMVGFNRRFSPLVVKAKSLLDTVSAPKSFIMTVNAGDIPASHWTQDREVGGGRIVGEGCHFIDLLRFLAGSRIARYSISRMRGAGGESADKVSIALEFEDGSHGVVHYFADGHKSFPKERLEIFCGGRVLQLDNFRRLKAWGWQGFKSERLSRQDKGHDACAAAFLHAVRKGEPSPIPLDEIIEVSRVSIEVQSLADKG
jgi:predicted dehydrogenase/threonine dehydrogenase-like Zn-dependent dehydrogenase